MIIDSNEVKSVVYHENYNQLVIELITNSNPTSIVIQLVRNYTEALQILKALQIPISFLDNVQSYY